MNQKYIEQLRSWISAIVASERTDKPTEADIITAFTDLIEFLEQEVMSDD